MNFQQATNPSARRAAVSIFALAASLGALAAPASAQDAAADEPADREIVVTGTLLRGVAPGGSNVVALGQEQIQATGAQTTAQLLANIPQLNSFGTLLAPLGSNITVNRPNLRSLPGFNTGGGSTTLVLLDGHRVVGMGNGSTTPDPDFIPPGALQRIDVVPDGGSAIYGSDAVAGVMNFITRRDFDGVEASGHYGIGDNYRTWDANATVGTKWDGGSAFISYAYAQRDGIFGRDRDYVRSFPVATGLLAPNPTSALPFTCETGNVLVAGNIYGLPFTTATAASRRYNPNTCDLSDNASVIGPDHRHAVMAGLEQQLSPALSVSMRANYFNRQMSLITGAFSNNKNATAATRGFAAHQIGGEASQTVYFQFGENDSNRQDLGLETWGVNAEFTYRPGGDWRIRLLGNYGESTADSFTKTVNDTALTRAVANGLFDPYAWRNSDPAALAALFNFGNSSVSRQRQINFRVIGDGTLLTLPGGGVKLAVGAEYIKDGYNTINGTGVAGAIASGSPAISVGGVTLIDPVARAPRFDLSREVKAVFGELSIPVFSAENETTFFHSLTLSASGRYDHYSGGVGGTFNPKFGINWSPVEGIRIRGAWGKAFNAPGLTDLQQAAATSVNALGQLGSVPSFLRFILPPAALVSSGAVPNYNPAQQILIIGGNQPGIRPQSANTLSAGADIEPSFVPGLRFGATYWQIHMKDAIGTAPWFDQPVWWNFYRNTNVILNPNQAQIDNALAQATTPFTGTLCATGAAPTLSGPSCIYAIFDTRKTNKGRVHYSGIDFYVNYRQDTSFGSIDAAWNGSIDLQRLESAGPGAPLNIDQRLFNNSNFRFTASAGANIGDFRAQVSWLHRQGYDTNTTTALPQTRVGAFNLFNLFFKYDVNGADMFKDLSFTLNVDNVFDQDPPLDYGAKQIASQSGYGNGFTLGRVFTFGVSKKF
jgi:iron complex outermembrane recepter protein